MSNPTRTCPGCMQTDDHPRHVVVAPDGTSIAWHMDCHQIADPPCAICMSQTADAPEGAKGDTLRQHLVELPPQDNTEHLAITGE